MEWISVKDRLPEICSLYIVSQPIMAEDQIHSILNDEGVIDVSDEVACAIFSPEEGLFAMPSIEFPGELVAFPDVTHWMPLPQPPK